MYVYKVCVSSDQSQQQQSSIKTKKKNFDLSS